MSNQHTHRLFLSRGSIALGPCCLPYPENGREEINLSLCAVDMILHIENTRASLVAQRVKHLPVMWKTQVRSLGREDPLEKEMATHSSILAWRIT